MHGYLEMLEMGFFLNVELVLVFSGSFRHRILLPVCLFPMPNGFPNVGA